MSLFHLGQRLRKARGACCIGLEGTYYGPLDPELAADPRIIEKGHDFLFMPDSGGQNEHGVFFIAGTVLTAISHQFEPAAPLPGIEEETVEEISA